MKAKIILFAMAVALALPFLSLAESPSLVINQLQISGDGGASDEFIEIYNPTDSAIDLSDWSIQYKSSSGDFPLTSGKKNLGDVSIPAKGYLLIAHTDYDGSVTADVTHGAFNMSGSASGGTVFLVQGTSLIASGTDSAIVDKVGYGDSETNSPETANAELPESEKSIARTNGADTDDNSSDFTVQNSSPKNSGSTGSPSPSPSPSPAPCSEPTPSPSPTPAPSPSPTPSPAPSPAPAPSESSGSVLVNEILPRPLGNKPEFIELANSGQNAVNLKNWTIADNQKTFTFTDDKVLNPGEFLALFASDTGLALDDIGQDEVTLKDALGKLVGQLKYEDPEKGYSLSKAGAVLFWSKVSTPGTENQILQ